MTDIRVEKNPDGLARSTGVDKKRAPRTNQVMVRFTNEGALLMDQMRGKQTRQDWLRGLVAAEYVRAKKDGRL